MEICEWRFWDEDEKDGGDGDENMETKNGDGEDDADGMIQMVTEIEMNRWRCHKNESFVQFSNYYIKKKQLDSKHL